MNEYEELIKTAQVLKTVAVTGEYWLIMQACVNSIANVAEAIKAKEAPNEPIDNKP